MKIYISSTFLDLREHREKVAQVLRRMGHTPLFMEDYVTEDKRPLAKCMADVQAANLYIGIFAWRYGHVPKRGSKPPKLPDGVVFGKTSITECEYRHAGQTKVPRLVFLLQDTAPWPPPLMDAHTGDNEAGRRIRVFRDDLRNRHLVSHFTTPDELAALVSAAVYRQEVERELQLRSLQELDWHQWFMNPEAAKPHGLYDTTMMSITQMVKGVQDQTYLVVDLGAGRNWWSTRLYFLASLAVDFTDVGLMVFIDQQRRLFGVSTPEATRNALSRRMGTIAEYEHRVAASPALPALDAELNRRGNEWEAVMNAAGGEGEVKSWVRKQEIRRWLGDALVEKRIEWSSEEPDQRKVAERIDRIIEWPHRLVPLEQQQQFFKVVDREALTEEIAKLFVSDRLRTG